MFKGLVLRDLDHLKPKKNVSVKHIQEGIDMLEKRKNIIIRPADKGGGVVILNKAFYHGQISDMLADKSTYSLLEQDPSHAYRQQLHVLVKKGSKLGVLTVKEQNYLTPASSKVPTIYTLPKIHKDPLNPPARPIVNSIDSVSSRMGQYLDTFLQKSVRTTKSYLKDTKDLLLSLQEITL